VIVVGVIVVGVEAVGVAVVALASDLRSEGSLDLALGVCGDVESGGELQVGGELDPTSPSPRRGKDRDPRGPVARPALALEPRVGSEPRSRSRSLLEQPRAGHVVFRAGLDEEEGGVDLDAEENVDAAYEVVVVVVEEEEEEEEEEVDLDEVDEVDLEVDAVDEDAEDKDEDKDEDEDEQDEAADRHQADDGTLRHSGFSSTTST
jgi:hypothetical protein